MACYRDSFTCSCIPYFSKCKCGDQIKEDCVGGKYSSNGTYEKCTQNFRIVSKQKQKISLGRQRHK
jgi:hypothetical protein